MNIKHCTHWNFSQVQCLAQYDKLCCACSWFLRHLGAPKLVDFITFSFLFEATTDIQIS